MDIVILYVNGEDPVWQRQYAEATQRSIDSDRFRDWGLLKYLFRGIERNIPFVDKVHLVVSGKSQIPEWISDKAHIVLHDEIIPAQFLPTFNSSTIEMFMHRIPGLGEEFIYFNDDTFPVMPCAKDDFFINGKIVMNFPLRHTLRRMNHFHKQRQLSDILARKAAGRWRMPSIFYHAPMHTCKPMLRSTQYEAYAKIQSQVEPHITLTRSADMPCDFFYSDYLLHTNRAVDKKVSFRYCSLSTTPLDTVLSRILHPERKMLCLNDGPIDPARIEPMQKALDEAFARVFPTKSKYER